MSTEEVSQEDGSVAVTSDMSAPQLPLLAMDSINEHEEKTPPATPVALPTAKPISEDMDSPRPVPLGKKPGKDDPPSLDLDIDDSPPAIMPTSTTIVHELDTTDGLKIESESQTEATIEEKKDTGTDFPGIDSLGQQTSINEVMGIKSDPFVAVKSLLPEELCMEIKNTIDTLSKLEECYDDDLDMMKESLIAQIGRLKHVCVPSRGALHPHTPTTRPTHAYTHVIRSFLCKMTDGLQQVKR